MSKWRACVCLPPDYRPPTEARIRMAIDTSPSAGPQSDESAITVGHFTEVETGTELALLDCVAGKWAGIALPDRIVSAIEVWEPQQIFFECNKQHGGELLLDTIIWRARERGVAIPRIVSFPCNNKIQSKIKRIRKIEDELISHNPPLLKIRSASFVDKLFSEVQNFTFDVENHGRADSCLDSLAYLCFGSKA
jgi:hypothetical protein